MGISQQITWRGRSATRLANGIVELNVLTEGGHLAEFRFMKDTGEPQMNVLWDAPWMTSVQSEQIPEDLLETAGFTGHALCLDRFGPTSAEEAAMGIPTHGEAAAKSWNRILSSNGTDTFGRWDVQLPAANLLFERQIRLGNQESVAYIKEIVSNRGEVDRTCHWVQHATFSPPFVNFTDSSFAVSGNRGITSESEYEGGSLLAVNREFLWPYAPHNGIDDSNADLRQPFSVKGRGFLAGIQLDPKREVEYLLALNWKLRLGVGYCFRREDFPWMAVWEENCARKTTPWNGTTQARGMEFGTTPLPLGHDEILRRGPIFGTPGWCSISAGGARTAQYLLFLFSLPKDMTSVEELEVKSNAIVLYDQTAKPSISIAAHGCQDFLSSRR
jgi:hypothetical protein